MTITAETLSRIELLVSNVEASARLHPHDERLQRRATDARERLARYRTAQAEGGVA